MGQAGAALVPVQCCQEEPLPARGAVELRYDELDLVREHGPEGAGEAAAAHAARASPCTPSGSGRHGGHRWACCAAEEEAQPAPVLPLESLSYTPLRFDDSSTVDAERSHARYSKVLLHSARARTQRRSRAWGDWLSAAASGRAVTLLTGSDGPGAPAAAAAPSRVPATCRLDRSLAMLSLLPADGAGTPAIFIPVDGIQVICPATEYMLLFDHLSARLDDEEKGRAVLLQYSTEDAGRRRACFLEESEATREDFVQALTALWLERKNDHSMWF